MPRTVCPEFEDSYIERCLSLPQGSFDNGLGNDPALDHLARIIRLFPWVLEVADNQFDEVYAKQVLVREGALKTIQDLEKLRPAKPSSPETASE